MQVYYRPKALYISNYKSNIVRNMEYANINTQDLNAMKMAIEEEIRKRSGKVLVKVLFHQYKGTGKAWVAKIDPATKKIIEFLAPLSTTKDGYGGEKVYELCEGPTYMINEMGTKSQDHRRIVMVSEGKLKEVV